MPLPKEVLVKVANDIKLAEDNLGELKDVVTDMRLSGMDTTNQAIEVKRLSDSLRGLKAFYERQRAKADSASRSKS